MSDSALKLPILPQPLVELQSISFLQMAHMYYVDYRKHWGGNPSTGQPWQNSVILNSNIGGSWGTEQHVENVETTPGTVLDWQICAGDADFSIELNQNHLATYTYRTPVNTVSKVQFGDSGYDAVLRKLCVVYPAPSQ